MLQKALHLAKQGFRVFPLTPGKKAPPCIKDHLIKATTDPKQIKEWWSVWPTANIGIVPAPDNCVLDIDCHKPGWKASFKKLCVLGLKETLSVKTYRSGLHMYHHHPCGGVLSAKAGVLPGIDLRADGSYVVGPGSLVDGVEYIVVKDLPKAYLPLAIVNLLPYKSRYTDVATCYGQDSVPPVDGTQPVRDYTRPPAIVPVGERDDYTWGLCCSLAVRGVPKKEALIQAKKFFKKYEQPAKHPYEWSEFEAKFERAYEKYFVPTEQKIIDNKDDARSLIKQFLDRYALIADGAEVVDLDAHRQASILKLHHWMNKVANQGRIGKNKKDTIGNIWLVHPERKTFHGKTYYPDGRRVITQYGTEYYNSYIPSDFVGKEHLTFPPEVSRVFFEHVDYLFEGQTANIKYFMCWLAFTVQHLNIRIPWAPLWVSAYHGVGKGWFFRLLYKFLGKQNVVLIEPKEFDKKSFNEWLAGKLVWLDDIHSGYQFYENMKTIISETFGCIDFKYGGREHRDIFANVIITSNHGDAIKIPEHDRRLWVIRTNVQPQAPKYYTRLFKWLDTDGPQAVYNWLMKYDLSDFHFAAPPPFTLAKARMIEAGRSEIEVIIREAFMLEDNVFKYDIIPYTHAYRYVQNQLTMPLTTIDKRVIGRVLNSLCEHTLPQVAYTTNGVTGTRITHRVALVRNPHIWTGRTKEEIVNYLQIVLRDIT